MNQKLNKHQFYQLLRDIDKTKHWELKITQTSIGYKKTYGVGIILDCIGENEEYLVFEGKSRTYPDRKHQAYIKYYDWVSSYFDSCGIKFSQPEEVKMYRITSIIDKEGIRLNIKDESFFKKNNQYHYNKFNSGWLKPNELNLIKVNDYFGDKNHLFIKGIFTDKKKGIEEIVKITNVKIIEIRKRLQKALSNIPTEFSFKST